MNTKRNSCSRILCIVQPISCFITAPCAERNSVNRISHNSYNFSVTPYHTDILILFMSYPTSSDRITQSKGEPEELNLPARTSQRRKSPNRETQQDMDQQPTGFAEGLDQLQQEAVVCLSLLPAQPPRPTSSRSITGPITGEGPHSRALSVAGTDEGRPQSTPPLAIVNFYKHCVPINQSRPTTGTIPKTITKFRVTFVSVIYSSIYRRQIQH